MDWTEDEKPAAPSIVQSVGGLLVQADAPLQAEVVGLSQHNSQ